MPASRISGTLRRLAPQQKQNERGQHYNLSEAAAAAATIYHFIT
jgi:hypothetical protein